MNHETGGAPAVETLPKKPEQALTPETQHPPAAEQAQLTSDSIKGSRSKLEALADQMGEPASAEQVVDVQAATKTAEAPAEAPKEKFDIPTVLYEFADSVKKLQQDIQKNSGENPMDAATIASSMDGIFAQMNQKYEQYQGDPSMKELDEKALIGRMAEMVAEAATKLGPQQQRALLDSFMNKFDYRDFPELLKMAPPSVEKMFIPPSPEEQKLANQKRIGEIQEETTTLSLAQEQNKTQIREVTGKIAVLDGEIDLRYKRAEEITKNDQIRRKEMNGEYVLATFAQEIKSLQQDVTGKKMPTYKLLSAFRDHMVNAQRLKEIPLSLQERAFDDIMDFEQKNQESDSAKKAVAWGARALKESPLFASIAKASSEELISAGDKRDAEAVSLSKRIDEVNTNLKNIVDKKQQDKKQATGELDRLKRIDDGISSKLIALENERAKIQVELSKDT